MKNKILFSMFVLLIAIFDRTTAQKLTLLKNIAFGSQTSYISYLTVVNDKVVFSAYNSTANEEPWVTDGTPDGTFMLKEINPSTKSGTVGNMILFRDEVYFSANDGEHGVELWKTDGTTEGTVMVKDICSGDCGSLPTNLVTLDTLLIFSANDGINGKEIWRSGGLEENTCMVKDLEETGYSIYPINLFSNGNMVYFFLSANKGLFRSDGTMAGTYKIYDDVEGNGIFIPCFTEFMGEVYFSGNDTLGEQLWKTNGIVTVRLTDIVDEHEVLSPSDLISTSSHLYFAGERETTGSELWVYDGINTYMVRDIYPDGHGIMNFMVVLHDTLIFLANSPQNGVELWTTDGTSEGTKVQEEFFPGTIGTILNMGKVIDGVLYYNPEHSYNSGVSMQLCKLTEVNSTHVRMLESDTVVLNSSEMVKFGNGFIMSGGNGTLGDELWYYEIEEDTNDTVQQVESVKDVFENAVQFYPNPVSASLTIHLNNDWTGETELILMNIEGKVIWSSVISESRFSIDLEDYIYSGGIYFLKVVNKKKSFVHKLIYFPD